MPNHELHKSLTSVSNPESLETDLAASADTSAGLFSFIRNSFQSVYESVVGQLPSRQLSDNYKREAAKFLNPDDEHVLAWQSIIFKENSDMQKRYSELMANLKEPNSADADEDYNKSLKLLVKAKSLRQDIDAMIASYKNDGLLSTKSILTGVAVFGGVALASRRLKKGYQSQIEQLRGELDARPTQAQLDELQRERDARPTQQQLDDMRLERDARPTQAQLDDMRLARDARPTIEVLNRTNDVVQEKQEQLLKLRNEIGSVQEQLRAVQDELDARPTQAQLVELQRELNKRPTIEEINSALQRKQEQLEKLQAELDTRPTQARLISTLEENQALKNNLTALSIEVAQQFNYIAQLESEHHQAQAAVGLVEEEENPFKLAPISAPASRALTVTVTPQLMTFINNLLRDSSQGFQNRILESLYGAGINRINFEVNQDGLGLSNLEQPRLEAVRAMSRALIGEPVPRLRSGGHNISSRRTPFRIHPASMGPHISPDDYAADVNHPASIPLKSELRKNMINQGFHFIGELLNQQREGLSHNEYLKMFEGLYERLIMDLLRQQPEAGVLDYASPFSWVKFINRAFRGDTEHSRQRRDFLCGLLCLSWAVYELGRSRGKDVARCSYKVPERMGTVLYHAFLSYAQFATGMLMPGYLLPGSANSFAYRRNPQTGQSSHYKNDVLQFGIDVRFAGEEYPEGLLPYNKLHILFGFVKANKEKSPKPDSFFIKFEEAGLGSALEFAQHSLHFLHSGHVSSETYREKDVNENLINIYEALCKAFLIEPIARKEVEVSDMWNAFEKVENDYSERDGDYFPLKQAFFEQAKALGYEIETLKYRKGNEIIVTGESFRALQDKYRRARQDYLERAGEFGLHYQYDGRGASSSAGVSQAEQEHKEQEKPPVAQSRKGKEKKRRLGAQE